MAKPVASPSILYRQISKSQTKRIGVPERLQPCDPLELTVIFTDVPGTLVAIKKGTELASDLHSRIRVVMPQVIRYPLPLTCPPVSREFNERRLRTVCCGHALDVRIEICLCRDQSDVFRFVLNPQSIVLLGGKKHWWPTREKALSRLLRRMGHQVIFAESGE